MHARSPFYMIYRLNFLLLLLLLVLDTTNHIIFIVSMPNLYCYYIFIFSFLLLFSPRVLLLVRFWQIIIIFQYLD